MQRASWHAGLPLTSEGVGLVAQAYSVAARLLADRPGLTSELTKAIVRRILTLVMAAVGF